MADGFVALETFVRGAARGSEPAAAAAALDDARASESPTHVVAACPCRDALVAARRFHAALADALEAVLERLLNDLACDVLARELRLAPAEIAAIAKRALERAATDVPVAVRAHPDELPRLAELGIAVIADSALRYGDVALDVQSGTIDASLGARLACVLEACGS